VDIRSTLTGLCDAFNSTLTSLCDAFNVHDLDRIMEFFSDDCVLEMPRGKSSGARGARANRMCEKR
jgi:ketosteroid isomerase-like protein